MVSCVCAVVALVLYLQKMTGCDCDVLCYSQTGFCGFTWVCFLLNWAVLGQQHSVCVCVCVCDSAAGVF